VNTELTWVNPCRSVDCEQFALSLSNGLENYLELPTVTFNDVGGLKDQKQKLRQLVEPNPDLNLRRKLQTNRE